MEESIGAEIASQKPLAMTIRRVSLWGKMKSYTLTRGNCQKDILKGGLDWLDAGGVNPGLG